MLLLTLLSVGEIATSGPCAGKNLAGPSETLLRGAHLRVMEMVWPPYAEKDPSSPSGWRGFDIDLLDAVAAQLGFTYTISEAPALLSGETYTDLLLRTVTETDLWLSWWLRSQERMNSTAMLAGHVDASPVLVSPPPKKQNSAPRFDAFFAPFSYPLWACIGLMIVASGFVDYALEYGYGGSLPSSIHEYFSGVLFGGFQDPHTRLSAFFQICCALIVRDPRLAPHRMRPPPYSSHHTARVPRHSSHHTARVSVSTAHTTRSPHPPLWYHSGTTLVPLWPQCTARTPHHTLAPPLHSGLSARQ
jgi:hypothetical protein